LIKRKKGKVGTLPSILGKLYRHRVKLGDKAVSLSFVTNARFNIKLASVPASSDRDTFCLSDLAQVELTAVRQSLVAECGPAAPLTGEATILFDRAALSVDDHSTHATGALASFLDARGQSTVPVVPAYKAILAEIVRRNNCETIPTAFVEICQKKGISRSELEAMLGSFHSDKAIDDLVAEVRTQLRHESFTTTQTNAIAAQVRKYLVNKLDSSNTLLATAAQAISALMNANPIPHDSPTPLRDALAMFVSPTSEISAITQVHPQAYLEAMIIATFYEQ
jgi:hypothetical protein